jgi:hypothetical protein
MNEQQVCVCGHPIASHGNLTGNCYDNDSCECGDPRPELPWPDSEGWWNRDYIDGETEAWQALVFATKGEDGSLSVIGLYDEESFLRGEDRPARFVKLTEESPFKTTE